MQQLTIKLVAEYVANWRGLIFIVCYVIMCDETIKLVNIVCNLEIDLWGGEERLRLNILDFAPSS